MTKTTDDFFRVYEKELKERPGLRHGQTAFNALARVHPRLANALRGTHDDPFYDDNRLPRFFARVTSEWETA